MRDFELGTKIIRVTEKGVLVPLTQNLPESEIKQGRLLAVSGSFRAVFLSWMPLSTQVLTPV